MDYKYKNSLCHPRFNAETAPSNLYNALSGANYDENTEIIINTLPETLFREPLKPRTEGSTEVFRGSL
jgi:hypothetical protein